ncbi:DUF6894 family protein [Pararhizobium gei]|uniref:DUF6894 family protein n=1 Tax=Pararhizobium gei TaxID=1395951 RepID=UPI0023DB799D|nr:hypothetical protein [Rhizobium gei]
MAFFYFQVTDNDGVMPGDEPFEFTDLEVAVAQAKIVLAEIARDGLPSNQNSILEVQLEDEHHVPLAKVSLRLEIAYP